MSGLSPDDRGLLLADGLFETLLWRDGAPVLLEAHRRRLAEGCAVLGLPVPDPARFEAAVRDAAGAAPGRLAVRVTWTAGSGPRGLERPARVEGVLIASAAPSPPPAGPATLAVGAIRRNPTSPAARCKTLAYLDNLMARREARAAGADEALMLDVSGRLACAAAANLFWIEAGALATPALSCGALAGIVRAEALRAAVRLGIAAREVEAGPEALFAAEGAFLTSSLVGVRPIASVSGRALPDSPLTRAVARALADVT